MKKTALIILNYNNVEDTINCIRSVLRYNTAPVKFIVVDNGSPRAGVVKRLDYYMSETFGNDYTRIQEGANMVWPYLNKATLLVSKSNDGYARGNNKGLILADNDPEVDHIMILNNDILFIENIIPGLLHAKNELKNCAIISPLLYAGDKISLDLNCARKAAKVSSMIRSHLLHYVARILKKDSLEYDFNRYLLSKSVPSIPILQIELPSGSCMLIDKLLFKKIGWFDPMTFLYYEEDILYKKVKRLGLKNYLCLNYKCVHLGAASTNQTRGIFLIKEGMKSQKYYVLHYSEACWLQKIIFLLSQRFYLWSVIMKKAITPK